MDIATVLGLVFAIALIVGSIAVGGGSFSSFIDIGSALVVIGGAVAACLVAFPFNKIMASFRVGMKCFFNRPEDVPKIIEQLVSLAEVARREGLLALESKLDDVDHPFIQLGIQLAIDGSPPEVIEDLLRTEIDAVATRHAEGKSVMDQMGRFAPAFGMIGTLMGLIMMLSNMTDPSSIGKGMAVALITTLYGAIVSNVLFLPFAEKLGFYNKQELVAKEIIVRGILSIQSGENPRVIDQKLQTFLPPKLRPSDKAA